MLTKKKKFSKILVTGGAGFIGAYVVDDLVDRGYKVYSVDDMSGGYWRNINSKCIFSKVNLVNRKKTEDFINKLKPDLIYHLAADATEGRSQFTPINCTERNYLAFLNTLVPAIKYGLRKIVVVSSMSVYGKQTPPFSEDMETAPEDIYAVSKAAMEKAVKILSDVHKFNYTIVRPHNVYGPRQNIADPYRNVIGIFINQLLNNKNYFIYGNGEQKRSFSYISDVAPYIVKAGLSEKCNGEILNIGPKEEWTINRMSNKILEIYFEKKKISESLRPKYLPDRPKEVKNAFCSNEKASKFLNYKTKTSLDEGLKLMIDWAKKLGPQRFFYLKKLEIENEFVPKTWGGKDFKKL